MHVLQGDKLAEQKNPLSHPQKRIWYMEKINGDLPIHTIGGCLEIHGQVEVQDMMTAIYKTLENNPVIQAGIIEEDGVPFQVDRLCDPEEIVFYRDFSREAHAEQAKQEWLKAISEQRFELNGPLFLIALYKVSDTHYGLTIIVHHIVSDGWSIYLLEQEICTYYEALRRGENIIPAFRAAYSEYIASENEYMQSERFTKDQNFWRERFSNLPEAFLYDSANSYKGERSVQQVQIGLSRQLRAFIREQQCSLNLVFIALLGLYINKTEQLEDIVIGVPVYNRVGKRQKHTVGMFTSTLPLRFRIQEEETFEAYLLRLKGLYKECLFHQKYPYDLLVQDLALRRQGFDSLFKMSVNYYNTQINDQLDGFTAEADERYCGCQSYQFQLTVKEWNTEALTLSFDYKTAEVSADAVLSMYHALIYMAETVLQKPDTPIRDLQLEDEEKRQNKLYGMNQTACAYPKETVDRLFEARAAEQPEETALICGEEIVSYAQLNHAANRFAHYLQEQDIQPGAVVAVMMNHSIELMEVLLGIMKVGGTYLPIDSHHPKERIHYILAHSGSAALVVDALSSQEDFPQPVIRYQQLDLSDKKSENPKMDKDPDMLAYIIYTSGSTGTPKGVMVRHGGLTNYACWAAKMYLKRHGEVMALYSSLAFDLTVTSLFAPLVSGNTIAIYPENDGEFVLYQILDENKATVVKLTPAHLELIQDRNNRGSAVRRFIVGGDELRTETARRVTDAFGGEIEIYNEYGPTETVVGCMIHKYDEARDTGTAVPIGKPADNVQIYILDDRKRAVPDGVNGELYIGGVGLARGYLGQEDLTKERFMDDPFVQGERMYRSGDLAYYDRNGEIYYAGRVDKQVKIKGFRIELGEINQRLEGYPGIAQAVTTIHPENRDSLAAYVIMRDAAQEKSAGFNEKEIVKWLRDFLPPYMIPSYIMEVSQFPLTVNGKLDYARLPKPERLPSLEEADRTLTERETRLVDAMKQVLGLGQIALSDNYYLLGGDSIKAIQIASVLKNYGYQLKVKDVLSAETVEEIARAMEQQEALKASQDSCSGAIADTPIVRWYFDHYGKDTGVGVYNQYIVFQSEHRMDEQTIRGAVEALLKHHDSLRIRCRSDHSLYYHDRTEQRTAVQFLTVETLADVDGLVHRHAHTAWDEGDLFRVTVMQLPEETQLFLFTAHHLLVDGVSWRVLIEDFFSAAAQMKSGVMQPRLPDKTESYQRWAAYLNEKSNDANESVQQYIEELERFPFHLTEAKNAEVKNGADAAFTTEEVRVDAEKLRVITEALKGIYDIDLHETLVIALALTLNERTAQDEVTLEIERHGRDAAEQLDVSRTVGWFTNLYPLLFHIDSWRSIDEKIKRMKERSREIDQMSVQYGVQRYLTGRKEQTVRFPVRFNYLGDTSSMVQQHPEMSQLEFGLALSRRSDIEPVMDIIADSGKEGLRIAVTYCSSVLSGEYVSEFLEAYIEKLEQMLSSCEKKEAREFTPSDFEAAELTQDDLDALLF